MQWPNEVHTRVELVILLGDSIAKLSWQPSEHSDTGLTAPNVCIVPANHQHSLELEEAGELMLIHLETQFITKALREILLGPHWQLPATCILEDNIVHFVARSLRPLLSAEDAVSSLYRKTLVELLAIHLIANYAQAILKTIKTKGESASARLTPILIHIHACLDQELKVQHLAQMLNVSTPHFCRLFKEAMGLSPYQYILAQRIKLAKKLLSESDLSIAEVALQCGFTDQSHFSLQFRRFAGITPKLYRDVNCTDTLKGFKVQDS